MVLQRFPFAVSAVAVAFAASLAACGGGGSSYGGSSPPVPNPTATPPPVSTQQVVIAALPSSVMGSRTDATFGTIGGYTQQTFSQVLGFAPGSQIMVQNGQTSTPHTLGVVSTTGFDATGSALSASASGGSTIQAGFNTGTINPGALVGPFTLVAGTYYIGCAFHYSSAPSMRTVLQVAANATPGPQATAPPGSTSTPDPGRTGY
jgi:hypothetical protein